MNNLKFALIIIFAAIVCLPSCKKGDNDPFISLLSRKARLTGEWTLAEGTKDVKNTAYPYTSAYNGTTCTQVNPDSTITFPYTEKLKINKAGTFIWEINEDDYIEKYEGAWYFGRKNKDLDIKSKETVCFAITKYSLTVGGNTTESYYSGTNVYDLPLVWQIDMLKKKEMTVIKDGVTNINGTKTIYTGTMTYVKD